MRRLWLVCGLLMLCAVQVGCGCGPRWCGGGCGEKYWGPYSNDPPRCEPCDCYGNWTGGGSCGSCNTGGCSSGGCTSSGCGDDCGSRYPWIRSRDRRACFMRSLGCLDCLNLFSCTDGCGGCAEPTCGEPACGEPACSAPSCGEPSCGEPGCGTVSAPSCGCGQSHAAVSSRSPRRAVPMQMVSRPTTVDYRMQPTTAGSSGCNCGKH